MENFFLLLYVQRGWALFIYEFWRPSVFRMYEALWDGKGELEFGRPQDPKWIKKGRREPPSSTWKKGHAPVYPLSQGDPKKTISTVLSHSPWLGGHGGLSEEP